LGRIFYIRLDFDSQELAWTNMCEQLLLLLQLHRLSDVNSSQHLFFKCKSHTHSWWAKGTLTSLQLAIILLKSDKETLHFQVYARCMKPISSVGTNAAKCVTKLHTMNAVLIPIAHHSKFYSLHVSFSDTCKVWSLCKGWWRS